MVWVRVRTAQRLKAVGKSEVRPAALARPLFGKRLPGGAWASRWACPQGIFFSGYFLRLWAKILKAVGK